MPTLIIPNNASIHTLRSFLSQNAPFINTVPPAVLELSPKWAHLDPMALAMTAAWGGWCQRSGMQVEAKNVIGKHTNYAARMKLFNHLNVRCDSVFQEHEESGSFMPLTQVRTRDELTAVIANVSALLHLDSEPEGLAAVRHCVSELIRNVLEHADSPEGAFVCAQRYMGKARRRRSKSRRFSRVTIAVADCGRGIAEHLGTAYPEAKYNDEMALRLAMQPGITGAFRSAMYGTTENAGAGLFITRAIAKITGGYFVLFSGHAAYRLLRALGRERRRTIYRDGFDDPRHDLMVTNNAWQGTVAAVEIATDRISAFPDFFKWIMEQLPARKTAAGKIKFTS